MCRQIQDESWARHRELGEALIEASGRGQLSEVRGLLAAGADPRYEKEEGEGGANGFFPLYVASQEGYIDVMQALLEAGADVNQVLGQYSISSLYQAAAFNQSRAIALLVRNGGDVNLASFRGSTPLYIAAQIGRKEAVIALLEAKAAVNQADNDGVGPVYMAAQRGRADVLKLLIEAGGDVNQLREGGVSPLMMASAQGQVECVKILLSAGADALHKADNGATALIAAIHCKHPAVEAVLRAHIANLEAAERVGG
jgi:ankyrin repeat protein